jgi:hypothetical protein
MAFSMDDALMLLRKWNRAGSSVRLVFVGPGISCSYSSGKITDVSETDVTFSSSGLKCIFSTSLRSKVELFKIGDKESVIPPEYKQFVSSDDELMLMFIGAIDGSLAILQKK